jgi:ATP-binding cassette, subfamily B, bacterial
MIIDATPHVIPKLKHALQLKRALRLVWESGPGWMVASAVLLVLQGILPLLTLYLMKLLVDAVASAAGAPDKGAAYQHVLLLVGLAAIVALLTAAFEAVANLLSEAQVQAVTDHMYDILHAKATEVDLEYYENASYYDALHRAQQEAPSRPTRMVKSLVQLGQSSISLLGVAGLLLSLNWGITVVLLAATLPGVLVRFRHTGEMYRWQRKRTLIERRAHYYNHMLTVPWFAKEIRLYDLGALFGKRFRDLRSQLRRERLAIATRRSAMDLATRMIAIVPVFACYAFVAYWTVHGTMTLGGLVMYYSAFQRGQGYLQSILLAFVGIYEDNLFLSSLYELLELKPKVAEPEHPKLFPTPLQRGINFDRVSFRYTGSPREAVDGVSLTIRPGEIVALVGENGSGKTTLIKLLCRLYDPTSGRITIDGMDLREFGTTELRRQIGVVFQDYVAYDLTARENIWLGNVEVGPHDERIAAAARLSGADEVIGRLKDGYDTKLGTWIEDGADLSIGEWQKIALARAFLRDAQVVILDEPTSALDARAEYEVFERFRKLVKGKTAILISHRLSSVRMADRIYVLAGGRIVESGTHGELICSAGKYARLFEMQAQNYR